MAGKGGGAWKVAYADFVTAMMAFFLVMWLVSQSEPVKEAIAHHFQDPFDLGGDEEEHHEDKGNEKKRHYKPKTPPRAPHEERHPPPPERIPLMRGERTVVGTELHFAEDSIGLDANSLKKLNDIIPVLAGKPNKIDIRGHATRKPPQPGSTYQDPWDLCYARCAAIRKHLIDHGIPPEQIRLSQAGPFEPRKESFNPDEVARNARVEVYLLSEFVTDLPGDAGRQTNTLVEKEEPMDVHAGEHRAPKKDDAHGHGDGPSAAKKQGEEKGHGATKPHDDHGAGSDDHDSHGAKPAAKSDADPHNASGHGELPKPAGEGHGKEGAH